MGATQAKGHSDRPGSTGPAAAEGQKGAGAAGPRRDSSSPEGRRGRVASVSDTLPEQMPFLTELDKKYLRETWRTLESDPTTVGIITFAQLFEENPSMKDVFEAFREIEMENVRQSQELRQHAARVMGFVNKVISRLDSEEKYLPLMNKLGARHLTYGAKPQFVDLMGEQFISVIRPSLEEANQWSDEANNAWLKLFQVISYSMKCGIIDGMEREATEDGRTGGHNSSFKQKNRPIIEY